MVMPYVEARTLHQLLDDEHRSPPGRIRQIARHVAQALRALHDAEIVHRDVQTVERLVYEDGTAVLLDFDGARFLDYTSSTEHGQSGRITGSD